MSLPLTRKSVDHLSAESFSFSFFCDICGKEWVRPVVWFETNGIKIEHEEARTLLWAKEHGAAFEAANLKAHMHFNNCRSCGKWVCDFCFNTMNINSGLCRACSKCTA